LDHRASREKHSKCKFAKQIANPGKSQKFQKSGEIRLATKAFGGHVETRQTQAISGKFNA
jgi:hypothetical protein